MTYTTTDLYLTAVLMTLGYKLISIDNTIDTKRKEFVLDYTEKHELPDIIMNKYYGNNIKVEAKTFVDSVKQIKSRLYQT